MKGDTEILLGTRSVGDPAMEVKIESMTTMEACKSIAVFMFENTLKQRFQFAVGRTEEDVMVGLGLSPKTHRRKIKASEAADFVDSLFDAPAGGREAGIESLIGKQIEVEIRKPAQGQGLPVAMKRGNA